MTGDLFIVDDNLDNLSVLSKVMKEHGHKVRIADDGRSALRAIREKAPDLVLLDIKMPGMSGFEVLETIKSDPALSNIPVIIISIMAEEEEIVRAFRLGCVDYITKPFHEDEVISRVDTHLRLKYYQETLEEAKEDLEVKALERTRELEKTNEDLREEIEERRHIEAKLQHSEERYRTLFEENRDGIVVTGLNMTLILCNQPFADMFGYTLEELYEMVSLDQLVHPEDRPRLQENNRRRIDGEFVERTYEFRAIHKSGKVFDFEGSFDLIRVSQEVVGIQGLIRDISEKKRIEKELHTAQMHYTDFINTTTDIIAYWKVPEGCKTDLPVQEQIEIIYHSTCLDGNKAHLLYNRLNSKDELIGKEYIELIKERSYDQVIEDFIKNHYHLNNYLTYEKLITGENKYALQNWFGVVENGVLINIWASVRDITNQKQAELALIKSETQYKSLTNSIDDVFFALDKDLKYVYWNEACGELYGLEPESIIGKSYYDFEFNKGHEWMADIFKEVIHTEQARSFESIITSGDQQYWNEIKAYPSQTGCSVLVKDISERKQAEAEILVEKTFTDTALDTQADTFFLFEPASGKAIRWNKAFREISGYSDEEIAQMPAPQAYYSAADLERAASLIQKVLETGTGTVELDLICKHGRRKVPTEYRASVIKDDQGKPAYIISIGRDISERKRMEKELRTTQLHYRDFINSSGNPVTYWKVPDGLRTDLPIEEQIDMMYRSVCVDANRSAWESWGFQTKEELIGKTYNEFATSRIQDAGFEAFIKNDYQLYNYEIFERLETGSEYYGISTWFGLIDDGCLTHVWSSSKNITEQKKAELGLRESEARYRLLSDLSREGIVIHRDGFLLEVNKAFLDIFGHEADELTGFNLVDLIVAPDSRERARKHIRTKHTGAYSLNGVRKDGTEISFEVEGRNILYDKQPARVVTIRDVTERKKQELLLAARLRLSELSHSYSVDELIQALLDEAEKNTKSEIGFFHFLEDDQETLRLQTWSTNTQEIFCTAAGKGSHYPISEAGVWVDCVHKRRPVIHNDYESLPNKKGLPEGHAPVIRELVVPIIRGDKISGILGVGNKRYDYVDSDIQIVSELGNLAWDIIDRRRAEETLSEREVRHTTILRTALDGYWLMDLRGRLMDVNEAYCQMSGYTREELLTMSVFDLEVVESPAETTDHLKKIVESGYDKFESRHRRKNGTIYDVELGVQYQSFEGGKIIVFIHDITDRKRAEEKIKTSLSEKELLLRELYHRTKNNIQVIISMLRMRARHDDHPRVKEVFEEMQNQMMSMALVHQKLHESGDLSHLNLKEYIDGLIHVLTESLIDPSNPIEIQLEGDDVEVLLETAIPCGIIINELVTNSIKHAFPDDQTGRVDIRLFDKSEKKIVLEITDNGTGLPEDFDYRENGGLGLKTVIDLVEYQLDGEIQFKTNGGFHCNITFMTELYESRI